MRLEVDAGVEMRTCTKCNVAKEEENFYGHSRTNCKECTKKRANDWYYANKERAQTRTQKYNKKNAGRIALKKASTTYGISEESLKGLAESQMFLCAICLEERPLAVDHCHTTGVVRGLLCKKCNSVLGYMDDDPERLRRAAAYLVREDHEY